MAHRTVGVGTSLAYGGPGVRTSSIPFNVQSDTIRIVAVDGACHVAVGNTPLATDQTYYIPKNTTASIGLTKASNRIVGITTGTTTKLTFPEGTQCPFGVDDYITVAGAGTTWFDLIEYQRVSAVDTWAAVGSDYGSFQKICTIDYDSSKATEADGNFADARAIASNKVSVLGKEAGTIYIQQVQISGDG